MFFELFFDFLDRGGLVNLGDIDGGVQIGDGLFDLLECFGIFLFALVVFRFLDTVLGCVPFRVFASSGDIDDQAFFSGRDDIRLFFVAVNELFCDRAVVFADGNSCDREFSGFFGAFFR